MPASSRPLPPAAPPSHFRRPLRPPVAANVPPTSTATRHAPHPLRNRRAAAPPADALPLSAPHQRRDRRRRGGPRTPLPLLPVIAVCAGIGLAYVSQTAQATQANYDQTSLIHEQQQLTAAGPAARRPARPALGVGADHRVGAAAGHGHRRDLVLRRGPGRSGRDRRRRPSWRPPPLLERGVRLARRAGLHPLPGVFRRLRDEGSPPPGRVTPHPAVRGRDVGTELSRAPPGASGSHRASLGDAGRPAPAARVPAAGSSARAPTCGVAPSG